MKRAAFSAMTVLALGLGIIRAGGLWPATGTARANPGTSISVSLDSPNVNAGDNFDVNVVVDTDVAIRGVQFALDFDPKLVQVSSVDEGPFLKDWAQGAGNQTIKFPEPQIDNGAGHVTDIGIAVVGTNQGGATGHGVLGTYHMTAKAGAKGVSPLKLSDIIVSDSQAATITSVPATAEGQVGIGGAEVQPLATAASGGTPSGAATSTTPSAKGTAAKTTPVSTVEAAHADKSSSSSNGLTVPWEIVGGAVGAVVVAGGVTFAVRRRRA